MLDHTPTDTLAILSAIQHSNEVEQSKVDDIRIDVSLLRQDLPKGAKGVIETETQILTTEDGIVSLKCQVSKLMSVTADPGKRAEDAENCSRRNNLCLVRSGGIILVLGSIG
ncbi:hypothetical protein NDU88_010444 [Pleurodeles waltl]|uniref:Uncharacterized protein n=1 Tax=Pleurodeles waltl TaxID=8319 RepID=A0AAV7QXE8_PLEWA|nr:hypothetical protein NDU88_010444 [Pleurodeles waltl]